MSGRIPGITLPCVMLILAVAVQAGVPPTAAQPPKTKPPTATPAPPPPPPTALRTAATLTRQMPFGAALDVLRHATTPPLNIVVLWKPLGDNAGIHRDTPIGVDGFPGLRVGQALDMLTLSLSAGAPTRIGYTVSGGVVIISTVDTLPPPKRVARVYDISDLVAPPAQYFPIMLSFGIVPLPLGYGGPTALPFRLPGNSRGVSSSPASRR